MPRLDPAVAAVRLAVRGSLSGRRQGTVLVACSGGPDSTALLAATVFELRRTGARVAGAVVDHGLQERSAAQAAAVVRRMSAMGATEAASVRVRVDAAPRGVEAGARAARYAALGQLAKRLGAVITLLGHTRDDQAETVLLGLAQGAGGRSVAGMRRSFEDEDGHLFARPLLGVTREQTVQACVAEGLETWDDPHNADPRFARARLRHTVLPVLERELGPGLAAALARTGEMLCEDLDDLDAMALAELGQRDFARGEDIGDLAGLPRAVRTRVLRRAALAAGCPPRDLTRGHVEALEGLVSRRPGVALAVDLPGPVRAVRTDRALRLERTATPVQARGANPGGTA